VGSRVQMRLRIAKSAAKVEVFRKELPDIRLYASPVTGHELVPEMPSRLPDASMQSHGQESSRDTAAAWRSGNTIAL
jgi:hypothetical protein